MYEGEEEEEDGERALISPLSEQFYNDSVQIGNMSFDTDRTKGFQTYTSFTMNVDWQLRANECIQKLLIQTDQLISCLNQLRAEKKLQQSYTNAINSFQQYIKVFYSKAEVEPDGSFVEITQEATEQKKELLMNKALSFSVFEELALERSENLRLRALLQHWIVTPSPNKVPIPHSTANTNQIEDTIYELNARAEDLLDRMKGGARIFDDIFRRNEQHIMKGNLDKFTDQIEELWNIEIQRSQFVETKLKQAIAVNELLKSSYMKISADKMALIMQHKNLIAQLNTMNSRMQELALDNSKYKHYSQFLQSKASKNANRPPESTSVSPVRKLHTAIGGSRLKGPSPFPNRSNGPSRQSNYRANSAVPSTRGFSASRPESEHDFIVSGTLSSQSTTVHSVTSSYAVTPDFTEMGKRKYGPLVVSDETPPPAVRTSVPSFIPPLEIKNLKSSTNSKK